MKFQGGVLFTLVVVALAGCGGGGGGGGGSSGSSTTVGIGASVPTPQPTANVALPTTQRAAAQSATSVLAVAVVDHAFAAGTGPSLLAVARRVQRHAQATTCTNNQTLDVLASSSTGETTESKIYYDAACTHVASDIIDRLTFQSQPTGVAIDATGTFSSRTGAVVLATRISGTLAAATPAGIRESITESLATAPGAAPFESAAYSCLLQGSSTNLSGPCSEAAIVTASATEYGETVSFAQTLVPGATATTVQSTGTFGLFSGAPAAIVLTASPAPALVGGTSIATGTIAESLTLSGATTSGTLTITDGATNLVTTVVPNAGGYAGTLARNGTTLATFTIDQAGNGTITYGDGTTATISGFAIS